MELTRQEIFSHPAAVLIGNRAVLDTAALIARAREVMPDPSIISESDPFFWTAEVSNDRLDSYYTKMSEKTLRNYQEDAMNGVAFQNSHRTNELSLGRSLESRFFGPQGNGVARLEVSFYTLPDLRLTELNTNDFIRGIRSGIVRDVSVGFVGGDYICSICNRNMLRDWDCFHIPGMKYDRIDPASNRTENDILAFAWVHDARLAEVSAVYEGATPGAAILKAVREAEAGRITPMARTVIEQRYRYTLPTHRTRVQGVTLDEPTDTKEKENVGVNTPEETHENSADTVDTGHVPVAEVEPAGESDVSDKTETNTNSVESIETPVEDRAADETQETHTMSGNAEQHAPELETIRALVGTDQAESGVRGLLEQVRALKAQVEELAPFKSKVESLDSENKRLATLADLGVAYRAALIEEAIEEGTRAEGNAFPAETFRAVLENASLDHIKGIRDNFRRLGDAALEGGRKTEEPAVNPDEAAKKTETQNKKPVNNDAYRV